MSSVIMYQFPYIGKELLLFLAWLLAVHWQSDSAFGSVCGTVRGFVPDLLAKQNWKPRHPQVATISTHLEIVRASGKHRSLLDIACPMMRLLRSVDAETT